MAITDLITSTQAKQAELDGVKDGLDTVVSDSNTLAAESSADAQVINDEKVKADALKVRADAVSLPVNAPTSSGSVVSAADSYPILDGDAKLDTDFIDFSQVRFGMLESPLCKVLCPNQLVHTLQGDLTWTRSTTATYIDKQTGLLKTAAIDEPREEEDGWLIEGASTNLLPWSEDISTWSVSASGGSTLTKSLGSETAPDGITNNVWDVEIDFVSIQCLLRVATTGLSSASAGSTHTGSFWVKGIKGEVLNYYSTGVGTTAKTIANHTFTGEWDRLTVSAVNSTEGNVDVWVGATSSDHTVTKFSIWGAQLEELPFASSYIPTNGSAVTRGADSVYVGFQGNAVRIGEDNSVFIQLGGVQVNPSGGGHCVFNARVGSNYYDLWINEFDEMYALCGANTSTTATNSLEEINFSWSYGETYDISVDGALRYSVPSNPISQAYSTFPANDKLEIGQYSAWYTTFAHFKNFTIYPFALNPHEVAYLSHKEG